VSSYLELIRGIEQQEGPIIASTDGAISAVSAVSPDEDRERGLIIRWSKYPTWIELHDPLTGEWHEVRTSECLPGVVAEADRRREQGGAA
jgi:hypothetical protein